MLRDVVEQRSWESFVVIGWVAKAQGRWGEIVVQPASGAVERFADLTQVFLEGRNAVRYEVSRVRLHKGRPVLTLSGVSDIGQAKELSGKEIRIPSEDLVSLPEDVFYHFQLVGSTVTDRECGELGVVEDVLTTGGTDVLVVRRTVGPGEPVERETLVPLCRDICQRVDLVEKRIEVQTPEGLVELNAN
jgi:16S rRNA processing protein RimM